MVRKLRSAGLAIGAAVALVASLAACGSSTASGGSTANGGSASAYVTQATANMNTYFANNSENFSLPAVKNPNALRGKTIFYLTAGTSSPAGTAGLTALKQLQPLLGFKLTVFNGQFTPSVYQNGILQAVAQHADVLLLFGIDCPGNEAALKQAHGAGIKIVGLSSVDCDEVSPSAKPLFDAQMLYDVGHGQGGRTATAWAAWGAAQADYLISKLNGHARVIQFDVPDFASTAALGEGFRKEFAKCGTCQLLKTVDVHVSDYGSGLQQKASQALLQYPQANAVEVNYDDLVTLGVEAAIQSSGVAKQLTVIAGEGANPSVIDLIRQGKGLNAGFGISYLWDNYAVLDTILRLLNGQAAVADGSPVILYDKDHNLPSSGKFEPNVDFASVFKKAWGMS